MKCERWIIQHDMSVGQLGSAQHSADPSSMQDACHIWTCVREVMGSIPVGDSDIFFVPRWCHVE